MLPTGIEIEYETFGSSADPTLLLVMGFTAQLTLWDEGLCEMFAARGLHVVRYDNRDCGLSTHLDGQAVDIGAMMTAAVSGGAMPAAPYTLSDMAADGIGLLDHLGVAQAHVMGASMGGMIVQVMAIEHPERLLSMTSVMSMPGDPEYGRASPEAMAALLAPPPTGRDAYIENSVQAMLWASKKYGEPDRLRRNAARDYDRAFYPEGASRQMAAIYATGDRSDALREVRVPTLVIHGRDDALIGPSGGERTAELIPGANLFMVADMGHDMPEPLWPLIVDAVTSHMAHAARLSTHV